MNTHRFTEYSPLTQPISTKLGKKDISHLDIRKSWPFPSGPLWRSNFAILPKGTESNVSKVAHSTSLSAEGMEGPGAVSRELHS